jgi:Family of unknown function (DUF5939)
MSESETLFAALRQSTGDNEVAMLERMVRDAPDHALNKMNALDLAAKGGIDEERVIGALLNAVGLGILEMSWNVICPSCAGVLSANKTLKTVDRAQYNCAFCAAGNENHGGSLVPIFALAHEHDPFLHDHSSPIETRQILSTANRTPTSMHKLCGGSLPRPPGSRRPWRQSIVRSPACRSAYRS